MLRARSTPNVVHSATGSVGTSRGTFRRTAAPLRVIALILFIGATFVPLGSRTHAGTLVSYEFTGFGTVLVDLFDDLTPITVANHLQYINNNVYDDSIIHRVDTGLGVIQGGGFFVNENELIAPVSPKFGQIVNEYSRANTRGTISMARSTGINSAESQWFFNTDDNSESLGQSNGGGYAVFGWVVGGGMSVIDAIAAVPVFNYGAPVSQLPVQNFTQENYTGGDSPIPHLVELANVSVVSTHASFQNPVWGVDVNNSNSLEPLDALIVINKLIENGSQIGAVDDTFDGSHYIDVTGNGFIEPLDALRIINALILQDSANDGAAPQAAPQALGSAVAIVPEPSALVLAGIGMAALVGCALFSRRNHGRARHS